MGAGARLGLVSGGVSRRGCAARGLLACVAIVSVVSIGCGGGGDCFDEPAVQFEMRVVSVLPWDDPDPIAGAEVCLDEPVQCPCVETNESGFARLEVPADSEVLLVVRRDTRMDNIVQRVTGSEDVSSDVRMTKVSDFEAVGGIVHEAGLDPTKGHVGIGLLPPAGGSAAGAQVTMQSVDGADAGMPTYFRNLFPSDGTSTDEDGVAFYVNVPPGDYEVTSDALLQCGAIESGLVRPETDGTVRTVEVQVRPETITQVSAVQCSLGE